MSTKWSFPLKISSLNVTESARNNGFGHIYWRNPQWETSFFTQWTLLKRIHFNNYKDALDSMHLRLTLQHIFQWMISAEKHLSRILIFCISHWAANSLNVAIFYVFTTLTLKDKFWSKYDSDVVRISSLMLVFRYF